MKSRTLAAVTAVLALAGSARAGDDPKPAPAAPGAPDAPAKAAKHENKISPEAKAAFEKMGKVSNNPVGQGLKDAAGTISFDMMGMAMSMKFTFKAPATVHVEPDANAEGPMKQMGTGMAKGMEGSLKSMLGIYKPGDDEEYDASLATVGGKEVLTLTTFKANVEESRMDFTLDANGLPATGVSKMQMDMGNGPQDTKTETTFTYAKTGDVYRLEKFEVGMTGDGAGGGKGGRGRMGGGMGGGKMTTTYTYTEIEKFAIATSWKSEMAGGQMSIESRISDLTVNGKKVEIKAPEPTKKTKPKIGKGKGEDEDDEGDEGDEGGEKPEKGGKK